MLALQNQHGVEVSQNALSSIFATSTDNSWLLKQVSNKDQIARIRRFIRWLDDRVQNWTNPDLKAYAMHLREAGLKSSSIGSNLATIRARYNLLLKSQDAKRMIRTVADHTFAGASVADRSALVENMLDDLKAAIDPALTREDEKTLKQQDTTDNKHLRLTRAQSEALIASPGLGTLKAIRDTAIIALALCTGLREAELVALNVEDLRQQVNGVLGVEVKLGKGKKSRFVPYGELSFVLAYVDAWLNAAGIRTGAIFRGFTDKHTPSRSAGEVSPVVVVDRLTSRITTRAIQDILSAYPIMIDGVLKRVNPHDLRRTYARRLYDAGTDIKAIQANLGHNSITTTERYIGIADLSARRPAAIFSAQHDLAALSRSASYN